MEFGERGQVKKGQKVCLAGVIAAVSETSHLSSRKRLDSPNSPLTKGET